MTSQLQKFTNEEFGSIRVIEIDGEGWFVAKDVADALGYRNTKDAVINHIDTEDRQIIQRSRNATFEIPPRGLTIINESGLYSLILSSKLPSAKKFKRWVTGEVLPSIRKHGAYVTEDMLRDALSDPQLALELFRKLRAEQGKNAALEEYVEKLMPRAWYCDKVLLAENALPITVIAKEYGFSGTTFNRLLHCLGVQYRVGETWLIYQAYAGKGYTKTRTYHTGSGAAVLHTYWTQKGRHFLYELLASHGIYPMADEAAGVLH